MPLFNLYEFGTYISCKFYSISTVFRVLFKEEEKITLFCFLGGNREKKCDTCNLFILLL